MQQSHMSDAEKFHFMFCLYDRMFWEADIRYYILELTSVSSVLSSGAISCAYPGEGGDPGGSKGFLPFLAPIFTCFQHVLARYSTLHMFFTCPKQILIIRSYYLQRPYAPICCLKRCTLVAPRLSAGHLQMYTMQCRNEQVGCPEAVIWGWVALGCVRRVATTSAAHRADEPDICIALPVLPDRRLEKELVNTHAWADLANLVVFTSRVFVSYAACPSSLAGHQLSTENHSALTGTHLPSELSLIFDTQVMSGLVVLHKPAGGSFC
jgi:hypothetical protein